MADESPAVGQFAAVVESLAATGQRRPLVARLTSAPFRMRLFPWADLRHGLVALMVIVATAAAASFFAGGRSDRTVFEGTWTSPDRLDGSTQTLVVGAGFKPTVHYVDETASSAVCEFDAVKVFTADGIGTITDSRLDVTWPEGGSCGIANERIGLGPFSYQDRTDTLVDDEEASWVRARGGVVAPTRGPLTPVGPTPACVDIAGGVYEQVVGFRSLGGFAVTATVPASWNGRGDRFLLERSDCLLDGWVRLEAELVTEVYEDPCHWQSTAVALRDPATTTAFSAVDDLEVIGPTATTLGSAPAFRWKIPVPAAFNMHACDGKTFRLWGGSFDPDLRAGIESGESVTLYLLASQDVTVGFAAIHSEEHATPAMLEELDEIIASLRFEP